MQMQIQIQVQQMQTQKKVMRHERKHTGRMTTAGNSPAESSSAAKAGGSAIYPIN